MVTIIDGAGLEDPDPSDTKIIAPSAADQQGVQQAGKRPTGAKWARNNVAHPENPPLKWTVVTSAPQDWRR